ncbi:outer membrane protein assembly factor BamE [Cellvibrio polysaccharolyticus]|uniref:Outer membrane protein assembly factor BamE n=1 Tax=Cellvibrio polysaccharolyticus TaxID=2082724 RepID=A0A928V4W7_9GAMM|nr:outer membrane protein assembly factor BamE [Cellvibrio polysaccharolyticus]MBE8716179.1 outer membrane protein assembly factor BamE [Cellvibrio polysaccharolyticus]
MKLASRYLLVSILVASLAGCSNFRFPGVHKINIQQGHIITEEMVSQLQLGQTKRQVRFVLGNTLLPDTFNDDRWDYYYSLRRGSDGTLSKYLFTTWFEGDKLVRWEGDHVPAPKPLSDSGQGQDSPLPTNTEEIPVPDVE